MAANPQEVVYHSPRPSQPLEINDQVDAPRDSMSHVEQQVFGSRPFWKWWWEEGPVDNCCCCFPLRTGIMLLSLINLFNGVMVFFVDQVMAQNIAQYRSMCSRMNSDACEMLSQKEAEADFIASCKPLLYPVAIAVICFSLAGMRAACTGNPKAAKIFMMLYPFGLVFNVVMMVLRGIIAPSTLTRAVQINFFGELFFCAYYIKVTWSFYHRRKVMEGMQLATDTSAQGQTIYMPVTQALNVV